MFRTAIFSKFDILRFRYDPSARSERSYSVYKRGEFPE